MRRTLAALLTIACTACSTSLKVQRVDQANPESRVGAPYSLLFTRFEMEITRQVAGCGKDMKALIKVDVKSVSGAPDPSQMFVVDTTSLSSPFKTGEVKLEYFPSKSVSTLNATAEDHTVKVVTEVVSSVVKIATIAAAAGGVAAPQEACSSSTIAARKQAKEKTSEVSVATKAVESRTAELEIITKKISSMGTNVDEITRRQFSKAYDALLFASNDQDKKKDTLKKAIDAITFIETVRWPNDGDTSNGVSAIPRSVLSRWGSVDTNPNSLKAFSVYFDLEKIDVIGRDLSKPDVVDPQLGIPYRQPVTGRLSICASDVCSPNNIPIAEKVTDILQMGYIYYFPCQSRVFSSVECTFSMTDAGQVKSMGASQKVASAEAVSGLIKDATTQYGTLREARDQAPLKDLQQRTALNKAQADYDASVLALQPSPIKGDADATALLAANTTYLNAQLANLNAQAALADAQAKANATGR